MNKYLKLMRPKHYIKNTLLLLPIFFSGMFFSKIKVILPGFISFCLISSVVYIINDIMDVEKDKKHPKKCKRPIASGEISLKKAQCFAIFLLFFSLLIHFYSLIYTENKIKASIFILLYFIINLLYSIKLKNYPILDVVLLSSGFLLRVLYGAEISGIILSEWLCLVVITFSFYMGFGKRRGEMKKIKKGNTREVLEKYTLEFLEQNMIIFMGLTLVFYALWTIESSTIEILGNNNFIWTLLLVIIVLLRYSYLIEVKNSDGDPVEVLLSDKVILILVIIYILILIFMFYGKKVIGV